MKRVSSRQRLGSWDAFDATRESSDLSDSDYSDNDHPAVVPTSNVVMDSITSDVMILSRAKASSTTSTTGIGYSSDASSETSSTRDGSLNGVTNTKSVVSCPTLVAPTPSQRRKRGRRKYHGPVIVPSFSWEVESSELCLDQLVEDVQFHILSFCDMTMLRTMLILNRKYRSLIHSDEATMSVWQAHFATKWPMLSSVRMPLIDSFSLPTAAASSGDKVNIPLVLSLTPSGLPTEVDETLLDHPRRRAFPLRSPRRITRQLMRAPMPTRLQVYHKQSSSCTPKQQTMIRYTGPIGSGDRCIRANHPMPRPTQKTMTWSRPKFLRNDSNSTVPPSPRQQQHHLNHHGSLFELICQGARAVSRRGIHDLKPFVSPYLQKDGTLNVTPRMVAYYEAEILNQPQASDLDNNNDDDEVSVGPRLPSRHPANASECVAVGIATESFHVHSRMPGWDSLSFGYHGDDGGIFHSSGGMVERFGPTFGPGDTIGCGIDYVAQGIFFTLNGDFLGYGWKNIGHEFLQNDLYPVVGIDTNAPIALNFGTTKPFAYDLTDFHAQHAKIIQRQYRFSHKAKASSMTSRPRISLASCG